MTPSKVLIVDDQQTAREYMARLLDKEKYAPLMAAGVLEAEALLRLERPSVVITDLNMPKVDGLEGLARFKKIDPDLPVLIVTAFATVETAVQAIKLGAFDYIRKPFEPGEFEVILDRAVTHRHLVEENRRLRSEVAEKFTRDNIVCRSRAMNTVMDLVARVAPSGISVLIQGESGTGKDLFAKRIHYMSDRASQPFVSLNCSAIPEHLLESELFGYEKGAFSGANTTRAGFCAEADGGTFFLDEIGDLSQGLQPKLLRVLQDGQYYPVGSRKLTKVDIRLVSATNQDLEGQVASGKFRQDLFYRINTVRILLPPLRDRPEDIPLLVQHFLGQVQKRFPKAPEAVSPAAMRCLSEYRWPGNVRELEHTMESAALICDGKEIRPEDLGAHVRGVDEVPHEPGSPAGGGTFRHAREEFERNYFVGLLAQTQGNVQRASQIAGIHRTTLYEKLAKLGVHFEKE
jgi:two-component system response regulator HydG